MNLGPQLSLDNALACLQASADCYTHPATFETELAHVLVVDQPDATIIAFRGSHNAQDWLTDFRCLRTDAGDDITIHAGFYAAIKSIGPELVARASRALAAGGPKPFFITGHSLGGALAVLAAKILYTPLSIATDRDHSCLLTAVYTFGGPRVGNAPFASVYDAILGPRTWRFVHEEDIVPRVPFWTMGYRHVGQEVFLPSTGGYRVGPPLWSKLLSDAIGFYKARLSSPFLLANCATDHFVTNYLARLKLLTSQPITPISPVSPIPS